MEQLQILAKMVDAGEGSLIDMYAANAFYDEGFAHGKQPYDFVKPAFNGSLDAAHSLHKAVLGDRWVVVVNMNDTTVDMMKTGNAHVESFTLDSDTPARAWLLAIIKAKISELQTEGTE